MNTVPAVHAIAFATPNTEPIKFAILAPTTPNTLLSGSVLNTGQPLIYPTAFFTSHTTPFAKDEKID